VNNFPKSGHSGNCWGEAVGSLTQDIAVSNASLSWPFESDGWHNPWMTVPNAEYNMFDMCSSSLLPSYLSSLKPETLGRISSRFLTLGHTIFYGSTCVSLICNSSFHLKLNQAANFLEWPCFRTRLCQFNSSIGSFRFWRFAR